MGWKFADHDYRDFNIVRDGATEGPCKRWPIALLLSVS